ncbi:hypothetical protein Athai_07800 [Actinocatenispora thailandica]|uniref:PPM-type phosphatase domain-containing protein n=1 Tax=Actinocatenispora thailandica TaxID=227318 RepID=A0A7R7HUR0_9ACTN|nr:protein phosphatase 2C domain-containing protein [Actinocatenispora thailandica]BCJ33277.1 hypothetical protein Athai_07800 [Actinocatenispora thailandica]
MSPERRARLDQVLSALDPAVRAARELRADLQLTLQDLNELAELRIRHEAAVDARRAVFDDVARLMNRPESDPERAAAMRRSTEVQRTENDLGRQLRAARAALDAEHARVRQVLADRIAESSRLASDLEARGDDPRLVASAGAARDAEQAYRRLADSYAAAVAEVNAFGSARAAVARAETRLAGAADTPGTRDAYQGARDAAIRRLEQQRPTATEAIDRLWREVGQAEDQQARLERSAPRAGEPVTSAARQAPDPATAPAPDPAASVPAPARPAGAAAVGEPDRVEALPAEAVPGTPGESVDRPDGGFTIAQGGRPNVEDAAYRGERIAVVADGMGGHNAGEVASALTVEAFRALDESGAGTGSPEANVRAMVEHLRAANEAVHQGGLADPDKQGMGTTLTALMVDGNRATLIHVGDSEALLLRDGALHSLARADEVWDPAERRHLLSQAVDGSALTPQVVQFELRPGDRIVLASDGLRPFHPADTDGITPPPKLVADRDIVDVLDRHPDPQQAADQLVQLGLDRVPPGRRGDNVTALVLDLPAARQAPEVVAAPDGPASTGSPRATEPTREPAAEPTPEAAVEPTPEPAQHTGPDATATPRPAADSADGGSGDAGTPRPATGAEPPPRPRPAHVEDPRHVLAGAGEVPAAHRELWNAHRAALDARHDVVELDRQLARAEADRRAGVDGAADRLTELRGRLGEAEQRLREHVEQVSHALGREADDYRHAATLLRNRAGDLRYVGRVDEAHRLEARAQRLHNAEWALRNAQGIHLRANERMDDAREFMREQAVLRAAGVDEGHQDVVDAGVIADQEWHGAADLTERFADKLRTSIDRLDEVRDSEDRTAWLPEVREPSAGAAARPAAEAGGPFDGLLAGHDAHRAAVDEISRTVAATAAAGGELRAADERLTRLEADPDADPAALDAAQRERDEAAVRLADAQVREFVASRSVYAPAERYSRLTAEAVERHRAARTSVEEHAAELRGRADEADAELAALPADHPDRAAHADRVAELRDTADRFDRVAESLRDVEAELAAADAQHQSSLAAGRSAELAAIEHDRQAAAAADPAERERHQSLAEQARERAESERAAAAEADRELRAALDRAADALATARTHEPQPEPEHTAEETREGASPAGSRARTRTAGPESRRPRRSTTRYAACCS